MSKYLLSQRESSKQVGIQNLSGCCATVFWAVRLCIVLEPIRARPGVLHAPLSSISSRHPHHDGRVLLRLNSVLNSFAVHRFVRPQLSSAKTIHLQFRCVLPCSCLCSSIRRRGLAFLARSTGQRTVDNLRRRSAAIAGFGTCCSEAESICVAPPPNRTYPEPVGRSGPRSHHSLL